MIDPLLNEEIEDPEVQELVYLCQISDVNQGKLFKLDGGQGSFQALNKAIETVKQFSGLLNSLKGSNFLSDPKINSFES